MQLPPSWKKFVNDNFFILPKDWNDCFGHDPTISKILLTQHYILRCVQPVIQQRPLGLNVRWQRSKMASWIFTENSGRNVCKRQGHITVHQCANNDTRNEAVLFTPLLGITGDEQRELNYCWALFHTRDLTHQPGNPRIVEEYSLKKGKKMVEMK